MHDHAVKPGQLWMMRMRHPEQGIEWLILVMDLHTTKWESDVLLVKAFVMVAPYDDVPFVFANFAAADALITERDWVLVNDV